MILWKLLFQLTSFETFKFNNLLFKKIINNQTNFHRRVDSELALLDVRKAGTTAVTVLLFNDVANKQVQS